MPRIFSYGSNMNPRSLRAKGVRVEEARPATSPGWSLSFALVAVFPHEGRMATLLPGDPPAHGVVCTLDDVNAAMLDRFEGRGFRYDRRPIEVVTYDGERLDATAYVALDGYVDEGRPTGRYLNLIVEGASQMGLAPSWLDHLRTTAVKPEVDPGPVDPSAVPDRVIGHAELAAEPRWSAVGTIVFDVQNVDPFVRQIMGGTDITMFWLRRLDQSDGEERVEDVHAGRLTPAQRAYIHRLQHDLLEIGHAIGRYVP